MSVVPEGHAASRDASWWPAPGNAERFHLTRGGVVARCSARMVLDPQTTIPADTVDPVLRCQRPGCRQAWPKENTQTTR